MKKQLKAIVVHQSDPKTVKVKVTRRWKHPIYKKTVTKTNTYLTHCKIKVAPNDAVMIEEAKPISKRKRWQLIKKI